MVVNGVDISESAIGDVCRRYDVARLSLFGSILRPDFDAESDVDIMVEFPSTAEVSLLDLGGLHSELSQLLGRRVHLLTPTMIPPAFRKGVQSSARNLYAA